MIRLFKDKHILLGVTGSIAAYKSADLASKLTQAGAHVTTILTDAATKFVAPLTFQSLTGHKAYTNLWGDDAHVIHVGLGESAHLLVIAPATADVIAKLAHGQADDLLTVSALAARCPTLIAPAMDGGMYDHPATQANLKTLLERGAIIVGPAEGRMASGLMGKGRMAEPGELLGHIRHALSRGGPFAGRKVVVTAGGTQEAIDPVRFISNHSSGKQGYALAQAALDRGAAVTLIAGPNALPPIVGVKLINVRSAAEMGAAVLKECAEADALIMAAAVADFRPETEADQKIKRGALDGYTLQLTKTIDILAAVAEQKARAGKPTITVGFAAETQNLVENAREKVFKKKLSLIVANNVAEPDSGFFVDTNRVTIVDAGGGASELPVMSKAEVAEAVCERIERLLAKKGW
ncbi:MAG TPA: bifunctional phosphopantothenoylcysteine decarboxylase/phosphopantothenate--cysteine ligase CoaBC [Anaerolineales bacterium]|nr:bifunctional phosphopantothenoylcysteine decarboxylase/phosphopantothenate--cysteine ligase CoaBC [Anaerolineales bacterium]